MREKIYLDREFDKFMGRIKRGENFTLMRFADGERAVMDNVKLRGADGWSLPGHDTFLGAALKDALQLKGENVYYGISCQCCDRSAYYWYMTRIPNRKNVTFSNIFVNNNYRRFLAEFPTIKRDAVVIANHKGQNNTVGGLNVLKYYPVGDQCVDFWENDAQKLIAQIISDFGHRNNLLYVVSAGPISEPLITALYRNNPENCYIDFGSSIDIYIHGQDRRPYSKPGTKYSARNCWMFDPAAANFDVSVVLSAYKKPEALPLQLAAIENQTLKPREILLFQDGINDGYTITFKSELLERFNAVSVSPENKGVWERFRFAMQASSEYVCIFDDDTIPGKSWLENCHYNSQFQPGIYGTIGVIVYDPQVYPRSCLKVGWHSTSSRTARVDFVGHSWFLQHEYLRFMFEDTEKYQSLKYVGEDMCLSFKSLQHGVKTFVPPHPYNNFDLWGSIPEYGEKYGNDRNAVSLNGENMRAMAEALQGFAADGWKFYVHEPNNEVFRTRVDIQLGRYLACLQNVKNKLKSLLHK